MNRQEALEWAADYVERAKIFEGATLNPTARLDILSTLADSIVTPESPKYADPNCTTFIQACVSKMKMSSDRSYRNTLKTLVDQHCWWLSGQTPVNTPHPDHEIPREPTALVEPEDEPATTTTSRPTKKTY